MLVIHKLQPDLFSDCKGGQDSHVASSHYVCPYVCCLLLGNSNLKGLYLLPRVSSVSEVVMR